MACTDRSTRPTPTAVRVGFVVSRAVGGAVVRNRVTRRLRALVAERLDQLTSPSPGAAVSPCGNGEPIGAATLLVVRARPAAATASFVELARDLDAALAAVRRGSPSGVHL